MMIYTRIPNGLALVATLFALAGAVVFGTPNLANAQNCDGNCNQQGNNQQNTRGAPGPIAGGGLPVLAVGYGVYWLIKRRRRKAE
jgi:hypothetical protein